MRAPMLSVLLRPSGERRTNDKTGHALLLAIYGAYQFITGAAHADEYPAFPIGLIYTTAMDLSRALQEGAELVESLE